VTHDILMSFDRPRRRLILGNEAKRRKTGQWPAWRREAIKGVQGTTSWAREFHTAYVNDVFVVLVRDAGGGVQHFMVSSGSQIRPTWHEMQRIKDELAGEQATAVEVYPPKAEIVDGADAFHIWVLPKPLPFGIYTR
jgi:hypothetical protein